MGFCQAGLKHHEDDDAAVRPVEEILGNGEAGVPAGMEAGRTEPSKGGSTNTAIEEEKEEEGRIMKGQKKVVAPGREEWDNHMRAHIPYRKWCPHCVRAKKNRHRIENKRTD